MSTNVKQPKKVFISYRRDDSKYQARMIYKAFARVLPNDHIFMDVDSIPPGEDFVEILERWVDSCDVLLALIGPNWVNITDPKTGQRRLDNTYDFVRIEIREALRRGIPVVPILLDGTAMPDPGEFPDDLKNLARRQAEFVEFRTFEHDVERLIAKLTRTSPTSTKAGDWNNAQSKSSTIMAPAGYAETPKQTGFQPGDIFTDIEGVTPEMVIVPAGEFLMGSGLRQHKVTISRSFAVGRFPVIFDEWDKALELGFDGPMLKDKWGRGRQPVINVSWNEAKSYADWLTSHSGYSYRLLTEAEWEYACRAGSTTYFSFGDDESDLGQYAWYRDNAGRQTHPVGEKKPNAFGLYDMHGNIAEWVNDWSGAYERGPQTDPQGPANGWKRVNRGGSWYNYEHMLHSGSRAFDPPERSGAIFGFRLARAL